MMRPVTDRAVAPARREDLPVRVREARPEDAAQMGRVFVDSYVAANRGIVREADLAGRSYPQSEAAWLRGMREIGPAALRFRAHAVRAIGTLGTGPLVEVVPAS
jgi:hypothetical protein